MYKQPGNGFVSVYPYLGCFNSTILSEMAFPLFLTPRIMAKLQMHYIFDPPAFISTSTVSLLGHTAIIGTAFTPGWFQYIAWLGLQTPTWFNQPLQKINKFHLSPFLALIIGGYTVALILDTYFKLKAWLKLPFNCTLCTFLAIFALPGAFKLVWHQCPKLWLVKSGCIN